jgi:hypothetical protein
MNYNAEQIKTLESYGIKILSQNCSPEAAKDKSLPRDSYLMSLNNGEFSWFDIAKGTRSDIFDAYYDMFGGVIKFMKWTDGTIPAKTWGYVSRAKEVKKKK